jgi:hypothetical protein
VPNVKLTYRWPKRSGTGYVSESYQRRLQRAGVTQAQYRNKSFSLAAARGHRETPEHPKDFEKNRERYPKYRATVRAIVQDGDGTAFADIPGLSKSQRTVIAQYWNAVALATGQVEKFRLPYKARPIRYFDGKTYGGYKLETRIGKLIDFASIHDLAFEQLYPKVK